MAEPDWDEMLADIQRMAMTPFTPVWDVLERAGRYLLDHANSNWHRGIFPSTRDGDDELYIRPILTYAQEGEIEGKRLAFSEWAINAADDDLPLFLELLEKSLKKLKGGG